MRSRTALKVAVLLLIVGGVVALYFSPLRGYLTREHLEAFIDRLRGIWWGPIALILAYGVGCIFAIPASLFIMAAAIVWGWKLGVAYAMCGGLLGASASYFAGRFLGE